jgi:hypothetical protein
MPLVRYARTSRITPASATRFCKRSIRMSWLTRSKNFSRSTSTTTAGPIAHTLEPQNGPMRTAVRTEAVAVLAEGWIKHRLQHLQQRLLYQPIRHRRDAKLALASIRLGDRDPAHRLRPVRPPQQLFADRRPLPRRRFAVSSIPDRRSRQRPCWPAPASMPAACSLWPELRQAVPALCPPLHDAGAGLRRCPPQTGLHPALGRPLRFEADI